MLTAVHCNLRSSDEVGFGPVENPFGITSIQKVVNHPRFDSSKRVFDVAVVQLRSSAPDEMIPAVLNTIKKMPEDGMAVRAVGYGSPGNGEANLRQVDVRIVGFEECKEIYGSGTINGREILADAHVCAGTLRGGCGTCSGDSGGPLLAYEGDKAVVVGISSFGVGCGDFEFPDGYARMSTYVDWVRANTKEAILTNK